MYWQTEIPLIVRALINDLGSTEQYSNDRIVQLVLVAAQYVILDVNLDTTYTIDIINRRISPDPSDLNNKDYDFIGLVAIKAACILDQSTFRTKAAAEGIRAALGPASLSVNGNLGGYKTILQMGPCATYEQLIMRHNIGNASAIRAIMSPFVGNNFDPQNLNTSVSDHSRVIDNQFF